MDRAIQFFLLLVAASLEAATYYVAKSGSDANDGSKPSPWLTLQRASSTSKPGDVIRAQPGIYDERVVQTISGTEASRITFVAEGHVVARGFDIQASYIRVIGFELTHSIDLGYPAFRVINATGVEILDNYIHHTSSDGGASGVSYGNCRNLLIRGNRFYLMNTPGGGGVGLGIAAICVGDHFGMAFNTNVVVEYNTMSRTSDFFCPSGEQLLLRNNVLGYLLVEDYMEAHTDGWQSNQETRRGWMESNWHIDCTNEAHLMLIESPSSGRNRHIAAIKNVSLRNGDRLWFQMRDGTNLYAAHNIVGQVGFHHMGGAGNDGIFWAWGNREGPSTNNECYNNIFTNAALLDIYEIDPGNEIQHSHDLAYPPARDVPHGINGNIAADPKFVDYGANNLLPSSNSPAIDAGRWLTRVISASGTGTNFIVENPDWFYDNLGGTVPEGHRIYVGTNNNVIITAIDYGLKQITVSQPITWTNDAPVGYAHRGGGPDMGAYEFGDKLLVGASMTSDTNLFSVIPDGDARYVAFYLDGVPITNVAASPYSAYIPFEPSMPLGAVVARVFAKHPQDKPIVTLAYPEPPAIQSQPTNVVAWEGGSVTFSALSSGAPPLGYQWRFRCNNLAGETNPVLHLPWVDVANSGSYDVVVTNAAGVAFSRFATLTVYPTMYASWLMDQFTPQQQANPLISGPEAMPAKDGVPNVVKYALGVKPFFRVLKPLLSLQYSNGKSWITYTKPHAVGDVDYRVYVSKDLLTWTQDGVVQQFLGINSSDLEVWRVTSSSEPATNLYYQLQIVQ